MGLSRIDGGSEILCKHPRHIPIVDYRSPRDRLLLPLLAQTWIRILLCIVGCAALVIGITAINVGWYVHVLNQRLELARQHIPVIQQAIGTDPRFVDVEYSTFKNAKDRFNLSGLFALRPISTPELDNRGDRPSR